MNRERLLLELGNLPDNASKQVYERQYCRVLPKEGKAYETWLLRQAFDVEGKLLVSHVSGPTAIFPDEAEIEFLDD